MDNKYSLTKVAVVCLCYSIGTLYLGMVGCGAVLVSNHMPKYIGLVSSIGEYAESLGTEVRYLGSLKCDKWINLDYQFKPQCIQIIQSGFFSTSCDLSPHCGHTVYQTLNSTFWSQVGLCYGVGDDPRILDYNNLKIFDSNWHKLCHFQTVHDYRYIFKDYYIYIGEDKYLAISEYFLDAFVIHNGDHYERQIPTADSDGKYCFHTINDYKTVTVGPSNIEYLYYYTNLLQQVQGHHNGSRIVDYHTQYNIRNGLPYVHVGMDVVDYQCHSAHQTTSLHHFTSIVGHIIYTAVLSLLDITINVLYTLLLPLGYIIDPFTFVIIFLTCLYLHYPITSSSVFATIISISVVILRYIIVK